MPQGLEWGYLFWGMFMKTLRVGIASYEEMKARNLAIAKRATKPPALTLSMVF